MTNHTAIVMMFNRQAGRIHAGSECGEENTMTPEQRRAAFITDIVEVCKRHKVMLEDELQLDFGSGITFLEHRSDEQGMSFCVTVEDIESAVREAVWPIVHGEGK